MPQPINIVAQQAMDGYYQDFKSDGEFFTLQDFIYRSGGVVADFYRQQFSQQYAELRQEKREEIISLSPDILIGTDVEVKNDKADFNMSLMSFPYDSQSTGVQDVIDPDGCFECPQFERTTMATRWMLAHMPVNDRIFWYIDRQQIKFYNRSSKKLTKATILHLPGIGGSMLVPDSILDWVVSNTVEKMKAQKQGVVIKEAIDNNPNSVTETEINKKSLL